MAHSTAIVALVVLVLTLALGKVAIPVTDQSAGSQEYMVGVGKSDVTGPAAEGMNPQQPHNKPNVIHLSWHDGLCYAKSENSWNTHQTVGKSVSTV